MKNATTESPIERRLAELDTEAENIIISYQKQIIIDADSPIIQNLQKRLKAVRTEQWLHFEKLERKHIVLPIGKVAKLMPANTGQVAIAC